jgi:hypothetical protein
MMSRETPMIHFACRCKHVFDLPDGMAGRQVQCPACQRLVDVPTMDELAQLSDDGTFLVDEPPPASDPEQVDRMMRAFSRDHVDEDGVERDLRLANEDIAQAGTEFRIDEFELHPTAPKYDPETGELIRPLTIAPEENPRPHPATIPVAGTALDYARADLSERYSIAIPFIRLFSPVNLAAMLFVLLAHMFLIAASFSLILAVGAMVVVGLGLVAHYGNVVEEVGLEERDELPRFLRHFNLTDDVWLPFVRIFFAWIICFGVGRIIWIFGAAKNWPLPITFLSSLSFDCLGLIFFPAIVLITLTSGSLSNLHPMRILGTIGKIGPRYAFFVILYPIALAIYLTGMYATSMQPIALFFGSAATTPWILHFLPAYGCLFSGIILMHYFAWLLGMEYRIHHRNFPWVFIHFERVIPGVNAPRYSRRPPRARRVAAKPPAQ